MYVKHFAQSLAPNTQKYELWSAPKKSLQVANLRNGCGHNRLRQGPAGGDPGCERGTGRGPKIGVLEVLASLLSPRSQSEKPLPHEKETPELLHPG